MSKETWQEFLRVQKMGVCNMWDKYCINKYMNFTNEEHNEYLRDYEKMESKFKETPIVEKGGD